eukprot:gene32298-39877_t
MSRRIGQANNGSSMFNNPKQVQPMNEQQQQYEDDYRNEPVVNTRRDRSNNLKQIKEETETCTSPTAWICDVRGNSALRPFFSSNKSSLNEQSENIPPPRDTKVVHNKPPPQQQRFNRSNRNSAVKNIFSGDSSDEEESDDDRFISNRQAGPPPANHNAQPDRNPLPPIGRFTPDARGKQRGDDFNVVVPLVSLNSTLSTNTSKSLANVNESRIIAPNVSKLSPNSAVEIRLQSNDECVAVLCSVDVLKMRSGFFHDVLSEQEKARAYKTQLNSNGSNQSSTNATTSDLLWREAITIPEASPFEAAAYLESLHEGRALFRGEWNFCWARLSVSWIIEDLILEYASQIETHMNKLLNAVTNNHWRTSANVLSGMRVAVFRKGSNATPTIVTGTAIESHSSIGYSKLRVAFDSSDNKFTRGGANSGPLFQNTYSIPFNNRNLQSSSNGQGAGGGVSVVSTPSVKDRDLQNSAQNSLSGMTLLDMNMNNDSASVVGGSVYGGGGGGAQSVNGNGGDTRGGIPPIIGDISEPFWVQSTREGSNWTDPDDLFASEARKYISSVDKKVFWEMARAVLELPELSQHCKSGIRNSTDLANVLKRPEHRVLWTAEAPDYMPKDVATELIRCAYVVSGAAGVVQGSGGGVGNEK